MSEKDNSSKFLVKLTTALHDPDLYARDPSQFATLTTKIKQLRSDQEAAELRWLEVAEMAEQLAR